MDRLKWSTFEGSLNDLFFRRMFLTKKYFSLLVEKIKSNISKEKFRSEQFLSTVEQNTEKSGKNWYKNNRRLTF